MSKPPSEILRDAFNQLGAESPSEDFITEIAQKTLLPKEEVNLWFDHLTEIKRNRKCGAEKAAATRRNKQQLHEYEREIPQVARQVCEQTATTDSEESAYLCRVCNKEYTEEAETDEVESWIECDICKEWFHFTCANVSSNCIPEVFSCIYCSSKP